MKLLILLLALGACARLGDLGGGYGHALASDGADGLLGTHEVRARGLEIDGTSVVVYEPVDRVGPAPAVVFLPGRVAPEWQYESYGRALASHGIVVAMRGRYSPFWSDRGLTQDARALADWLVAWKIADPARLGVAGHSMGAKAAIQAALDDPRFRVVVALEPDDNGRRTVARGPIAGLHAELLLIGAEVAWKAARICSTKPNNYEQFYAHAPPGTTLLMLRGADHVQVMDQPDAFGMFICRSGTANSLTVRRLARLAMVDFFANHLAGEPAHPLPLGNDATLVTKGAPDGAERSDVRDAPRSPARAHPRHAGR